MRSNHSNWRAGARLRLPLGILTLYLLCTLQNAGAQNTIGLLSNTPQSFDGYTLFAPIGYTETYLINNCGEKVHSWPNALRPGLSVYLLENGNLVRTGKSSNGQIWNVQILDWNGNVIWDYEPDPAIGQRHHDIEVMPNGNILMILTDERTQAEWASKGGGTNQNTVDLEQIIEVEPDTVNGGGTIVWQWKAWDHLIQEVDMGSSNYADVSETPGGIDVNYLTTPNGDLLHCNAIDYNEDLDQIILSHRNINELWVIDHSTTTAEAADTVGGLQGKGGRLLFRWGNQEAYDQGTVANQKLFNQHDATWIPTGYWDEGKILVFNNRAGTPYGLDYSTVDVIDPNVDQNGAYTLTSGVFEPGDFHWTFSTPDPTDFFSVNISGAQRLPNGNTLICEGANGRFLEVDSMQNIVWEYVNPVDNSGPMTQYSTSNTNGVFRCTRFAPDHPALVGRTLTPQGYIEIGSTHNCDLFPTGVSEYDFQGSSIDIYPNPSNDMINVVLDDETAGIDAIEILDLSGRSHNVEYRRVDANRVQLEVSHLDVGTYIFTILTADSLRAAKFTVQ